jgi:hypothetical protein
LTIPEVRRLILIAFDDPACWHHRMGWSHFRRRHQLIAKHAHIVRRAIPHLTTGAPPLQTLGRPLLDLTPSRWRRIHALLPRESGTGRPRHDDRRILAAILWVIRTGAGWTQVPATFPPAATVQRRYRRWHEHGAWTAILTILTDPGEQII